MSVLGGQIGRSVSGFISSLKQKGKVLCLILSEVNKSTSLIRV